MQKLTGRVKNILISVGIDVSDEESALVAASNKSMQDFLRVPNCGSVSVNQLHSALLERGLDFAVENESPVVALARIAREQKRILDSIRYLESKDYKVTK